MTAVHSDRFARSAQAGGVSLFHNPNNAAISSFDAPAMVGLFDFRAVYQEPPCRNIFPGNHLQRCRKNRPDLQSGWITVRFAH